ncbi:MAG: hypothetical protein LBS60_07960 [Deltaproteobacteria bacterium]|nr:hypothetical protein [Deltaproteobacteria bacterium]
MDRHEAVAARPEIKKAYREWGLKKARIDRAMAATIATAEVEIQLEMALKGFRNEPEESAWPGLAATLSELGYPDEVIASAESQIKAERLRENLKLV